MSLFTRLLGRLWHLPAPLTRDIASEALRLPMRDGVELAADRYYARGGDARPTLLIRTCYGRGTIFKILAALFAERGMQVVVESCRGTAGSQGVFRPFFDEQNDGEDTVRWMERQPWFNGSLALWGISYLGNTAWAVANSSIRDRVQAVSLHVTLTNFRDRTYAFGGYTLETCIGWTATMLGILRDRGRNPFTALLGARKMGALAKRATAIVPLRQADRVLAHEGVSWWQDWMDHAEPGDAWWDAVDYGAAAETLPATTMVAGWYDIFLPWQLKDFMRAQRAGRDVRITIGPWMHAASAGIAESMRQSIALFEERFGIASARHAGAASRLPVRLFLMGASEWREYPEWPIPGAIATACFLHEKGAMDVRPPDSNGSSAFDYDPADPTPSFYGPALEGSSGSGDMAELERRADVLTFTTQLLAADLDAIGPVAAEIFLRSNTEHIDLYLCLCDVTPESRSSNVCDGYKRLRPGGPSPDERGIQKVRVEFWPTAYRFARGHRIRVIVAGGAYPRYARNPGSGEPLGDARRMIVAHQEILHGPEYPSALLLPVVRR